MTDLQSLRQVLMQLVSADSLPTCLQDRHFFKILARLFDYFTARLSQQSSMLDVNEIRNLTHLLQQLILHLNDERYCRNLLLQYGKAFRERARDEQTEYWQLTHALLLASTRCGLYQLEIASIEDEVHRLLAMQFVGREERQARYVEAIRRLQKQLHDNITYLCQDQNWHWQMESNLLDKNTILASAPIILAKDMAVMLQTLSYEKTQITHDLAIIAAFAQKYDQAVIVAPQLRHFFQALACVTLSGVGLVIGGAAGMVVGGLFGLIPALWTTPQGAYNGALIGRDLGKYWTGMKQDASLYEYLTFQEPRLKHATKAFVESARALFSDSEELDLGLNETMPSCAPLVRGKVS